MSSYSLRSKACSLIQWVVKELNLSSSTLLVLRQRCYRPPQGTQPGSVWRLQAVGCRTHSDGIFPKACSLQPEACPVARVGVEPTESRSSELRRFSSLRTVPLGEER